MEKKNLMKAAGAVVLGLGLVAVGVHDILEKPQVIVKNVTGETIIVEVPVVETVTETVEIEKIVNVVNPVNLQLKEEVQDLKALNDAALDMLEDEVDDDIDADYIMFEVEAKMEAENWIEDNMVDLLDDEDFFDNGEEFENYRESEVSVKTIYDPIIEDRDFDDKDLMLSFEVKMKAKESGEDVEYSYFVVSIPFEDGRMEVDDINVDLI